MTDFFYVWTLNVLLQVTCVSACGLLVAILFRRHATTKSWILCSALLLLLVSPPTGHARTGSGLEPDPGGVSQIDARPIGTTTPLI